MEETKTNESMVILRDKGRVRSSTDLLIRSTEYVTIRNCTVPLLYQNKTFVRYMK